MNAQTIGSVDLEAGRRAHSALATLEEKLPPDALRMLAQEVIVRLASRYNEHSTSETRQPTDREINTLADALLSDDRDKALKIVLALKAEGVPRDTLYLGYIAGAARCLGVRWERDEVPFTDVTIAAGRLYIIMRALRPNFVADVVGFKPGARALFAATPGENHTLGVVMAADMLRQRGWHIDVETSLDHDDLVEAAAAGKYPIIGLSASSAKMILPLTRIIASLRVTSPASAILVSGELTKIEPDLADTLDADSVVSDAPTAIAELDRLISVFLQTDAPVR